MALVLKAPMPRAGGKAAAAQQALVTSKETQAAPKTDERKAAARWRWPFAAAWAAVCGGPRRRACKEVGHEA
jgi:hypothetical protein